MSSPSAVIGPFVVGEKPAPLQYTFQDSNGNALNINGYAVKFSVREQFGTPSIFDGVLISGGNTGIVQYSWTGAEFPTAGSYFAEFWVGNGTQRFASWLITFSVRLPVGVVPSI